MARRTGLWHAPIIGAAAHEVRPLAIVRKEALKMRKIMAIGILLLAGCQNVAGPFMARPGVRVDDPRISLDEQKTRARDQLSMPDDFSGLAPKSGGAIPGSGYGNR
jgi:hypothetical protein